VAIVGSGASARLIREKANAKEAIDSALGVWEAIESICSSSWGVECLEHIVLVKFSGNIKVEDLEHDLIE